MTDDGVSLARRQLRELAEVSDGAVQVLDEHAAAAGDGGRTFIVDLDTSLIAHAPGGIRIRDREWFEITVRPGFPFEVPNVKSSHRRWLRTPHVHYGRTLCLYAATSVEWNPSDGMRGFIERLSEWLERAAAATLDPNGLPLHPPVVYSKFEAGRLIVHPDLGDRVPWSADGTGPGPKTLLAWCAVKGKRVDLLEWIDLPTAYDRALGEDPVLFHGGHPIVLIPAVMICDEFGFEFPTEVKALSEGLAESGYDKEQLLSDIATATVINVEMRKRQVAADPVAAGAVWDEPDDPSEDWPLLTAMVVATPSRRPEGDHRLAHIAAWKLDSLGASITTLFADVREREYVEIAERVESLAFKWFDFAKLQWMWVMENRPEVTRRRDAGTPASWLDGKRVLVLGAGALGGPVAEACIRAGVRELTVADSGLVSPGIVVRQLFTHDDIGRAKAAALAERLSGIRGDLDVVPIVGNVRTELFAPGQNLAYDLVIDATADSAVRAVIERARKGTAHRPPLVTMVIGHDADRGLVTVNLPSSSGAGLDAFRKVALHASSGAPGWRDIADDIFPQKPRTKLFFPEPGCSDPTFVGSFAQTSALAGMLLHEALTALVGASASKDGAGANGAGSPTLFASAVRLGDASAGHGTVREQWHADLVQHDASGASGAFEVRVSREALAEIRAEVRRGARTRGPSIETGGMLLGTFDDATGIVYVDRVAGPPPDSFLSEMHFQHGVEGTQERVEAELKRSRHVTGFVGFWHSHPRSHASPSPTDEQGMARVVGPDGSTQRALMMIVGGGDQPWAKWRNDGGDAPPETYLRVVPRSAQVADGHPGYVGGLDLQLLPAGKYFRGSGGPPVQVVQGGRVVHGTNPVETRSFWSRIFGGAR